MAKAEKTIPARLCLSFALLCALCIITSWPVLARYVISDTSGLVISCAVGAIFLYCICPLIPHVKVEVGIRKPGMATLAFVVMCVFWLQGLRGMMTAKTTGEYTEFAAMQLVIMSGYSAIRRTSKKLSISLEDQKKQVDDILSSLDEVIWSMRTDTLDILYANAACEKVTGYTSSEIIRDRDVFFDLIYPEDSEMFYASIGRAITEGQAVCEFRIYHKRGTVRYLRGEAKVQKRADGVTILNGITMDITRQRLAEMQLRQTAEEVKTILNSINDVFFAVDNNCVITYVNAAFEDLYRRPAADLLGLRLAEVMPGEIFRVFSKHYRVAIGQASSSSFEVWHESINRCFLYKIYPSGHGVSVYFSDITLQKRMMEQILCDKQKLQEQNEKLSEIAWIQAHKVRAPLANIMGLIPLLNISDTEDPDNVMVINNLRLASEKLDNVIKEISDKATTEDSCAAYQSQYHH